jgi:hypothetical protein
MKRSLIGLSLFFIVLGPLGKAQAQDSVAPGAVAALARKTSTSELQNWIFAAGALVSATAGILLVSWDPGAHQH